MTRFRRLICGCVLAAVTAACSAGAASAATFYVNQRGSTSTCLSKGINACPTINEAIAQAEKTPGPNRIEVDSEGGAEGLYHESLKLLSTKDSGLTINGDEPGVVILGKAAPAVDANYAGTLTLANLSARTTEAALLHVAIFDEQTALTLDNVAISNEQPGGLAGIDARGHGTVTMNGGSVELEGTVGGFSVLANEAALALSGVKILNGAAAPDESGGVLSEKSTLAMENTLVSIEGLAATKAHGIQAAKDASVSLTNDTVKQNGSKASGVLLEGSPATVNGLNVEMLNPANQTFAVASLLLGGSSSFSHLQTGGKWQGAGFIQIGGNVTIEDSHVAGAATGTVPALLFGSSEEGTGLLVARTVVQGAPLAEGSLFAEGGNVTLDSSEVLGGAAGVVFQNKKPGSRTLTVSASTIDANAAGLAGDAPGVSGVLAQATTEPGVTVNVAIQGSIVLEPQVAQVEVGDHATIGCSYSAVPSQTQSASGGSGSIACASGSVGNTEASPLSSLFPEPLSGYQLSPPSSAVDSVPAAAIALPFGIVPSATDLLGNPRVVDGNGDCIAIQDKGALELQGHSAPCPPAKVASSPPPKPPVAGVISALTVSPSAFSAAPKGATISKASKKKKYGAKITYRDSQAATTTFTVLLPLAGRMQGKSCKKPGRSNKHGRHCTLYKPLGSFTHPDVAGANSLHFSGRLHGKKLAKGSYRLQAVAHDAAGNGAAVNKGFTIK